jgi:hypothetical protein
MMTSRMGSSDGHRAPTRTARSLGIAALTGLLAVGCGGGSEEGTATNEAPTGVDQTGTDSAPVVAEPSKASRMASAVPDSKTTAAIDLQYDLPAKPEIGQPFTVQLSVTPRLSAETLDVEIGDSPGITIEGERMARFVNVQGGEPQGFEVQARGDTAGLFYVSVIARTASKVQSEGRAFSVPVVIGTPPAAQKPSPQKDATGEAIESMPAREE